MAKTQALFKNWLMSLWLTNDIIALGFSERIRLQSPSRKNVFTFNEPDDIHVAILAALQK